MATGCGSKEVYRFPQTTYPYSSCICSFLQQHPYFLFIFLKYFSFFIITTSVMQSINGASLKECWAAQHCLSLVEKIIIVNG